MTIGPPRDDETDLKFHWIWEDKENRSLQVFFYLKEWSNLTVRQKSDWLAFAQRGGTIQASYIVATGHDQCEWTVIKQYDDASSTTVHASKNIRILGLSEFLATVPKKP